VVFAAAALLLETKKPGAGCLACPRLELPFDYSLLRRSLANLRADLSIAPIIIVVTKYAHFYVSPGFHTFLRNRIYKLPRSLFEVKHKEFGQWFRRRSKSHGGTGP